MSLLYKDPKDVITSVKITREDDTVCFLFSADCGKFGTEELLDGYSLTPEELLIILQNHFDND